MTFLGLRADEVVDVRTTRTSQIIIIRKTVLGFVSGFQAIGANIFRFGQIMKLILASVVVLPF